MFVFRLLLGDVVKVDVESQYHLSRGFKVEGLAGTRHTAAIFVAYIEWWPDRHVCHGCSWRMFRKIGSVSPNMFMHDKIV